MLTERDAAEGVGGQPLLSLLLLECHPGNNLGADAFGLCPG
ncbi:MAG TPA: hypothetical protein VIK91_17815 [Nannocystis sp.]